MYASTPWPPSPPAWRFTAGHTLCVHLPHVSGLQRPAIRIACLCGVRAVYVFTHDSIGVGEDGPTHQPVEQVMGLRGVPNLTVIRPCDAQETVFAYRAAFSRTEGPTALILTRQDVPAIARKRCAPAKGLEKGAYILWESARTKPDCIIIATGSEVSLALEAAYELSNDKIKVRVVSMPSWELFEAQCPDYRQSVLPAEVRARVAVEAGLRLGWERYVGLDGVVIGMDGFGASAPLRSFTKNSPHRKRDCRRARSLYEEEKR